VQDPLAELILAGEIADGQRVAISADRGGITIDGRAVGRGRAAEDAERDEPGTVVRFPKGA
jgi:hypothetical protein